MLHVLTHPWDIVTKHVTLSALALIDRQLLVWRASAADAWWEPLPWVSEKNRENTRAFPQNLNALATQHSTRTGPPHHTTTDASSLPDDETQGTN